MLRDKPAVRAVFFDVDFTLIYPGPTFQGEGYARFSAKHGLEADAARFPDALIAASSILDDEQELRYNHDLFVRYTRRILEVMGARGDALDVCASEIVDQWAACQHFFLYDDVTPVLQQLDARGVKVGLISNSHRCLASFQQHFELHGLIAGAISSSDHGFLKPHPSIFEAALRLVGVAAEESMMVGDSLAHDIEGALGVGMRGVLVRRADPGVSQMADPPHVPIIRTLTELPALL
jgi:putative hydrolase of the HAD superfamily